MPFVSSFSRSFYYGRRPQYINPLSATVGLVGAIAWFNADLGTTQNFNVNLTDGSKVNQWLDRSGYGRNANSIGNAAFRPTWQQNILNTYGAVRYNGIAQSSNVNPINWLTGRSGVTVYVVARNSVTTGIRPLVTTNTGDCAIGSDGSFWQVGMAGAVGTSSIVPETSNFHIYTLIFDGTQATNSDRLRFRYDKVYQPLTFTGTVGTVIVPGTNYYFATDGGGVNYWGGDIVEISIWGAALTEAEIAVMDDYFSQHWNL